MSGNLKMRGTFYVLLCVFLWALIPVVAKLGQLHLDNHQFLFWSSLVSLFVLASALFMTGQHQAYLVYKPKDWLNLSVLGLLGTYVYYLFLYLGYAKAKGMEVLVIQYTWPILIVIFSILILKEGMTLRKFISISLGFGGVVVMVGNGIELDNLFVIALVGAGACCFALFSVLSKKVSHPAISVVTYYFLVATIASFLSMMYFSGFAWPSESELFPILLNGILINGFSYLSWMLALRATDASYLAPFTFITPVLSVVYLVVFFDEPFILVYGIGLGLVLLGGLVNSIPISSEV